MRRTNKHTGWRVSGSPNYASGSVRSQRDEQRQRKFETNTRMQFVCVFPFFWSERGRSAREATFNGSPTNQSTGRQDDMLLLAPAPALEQACMRRPHTDTHCSSMKVREHFEAWAC